MIIHLEINDGCMYDKWHNTEYLNCWWTIYKCPSQHTLDGGEVINCAPNQNQWLWIPNHPRHWEWSLLLQHQRRLVFSSISNSIPITSFTYIRASPTNIRRRNYTKRSSVNDLNAKERNVETSRVHNHNAKITGRTVWLKTELRCYTRPRIAEASNGTRLKYVNINTPNILSNFIDDYYFLYFQMPRLPKHPTLIDYHTSNWGLVPQATAVSHWTPPGL